MNMNKTRYCLLLLGSLATPGLAQTPAPADFCRKDPRTEIRSFCPWLSELVAGTVSKKSQSDMQGTLNRLNPANPASLSTTIAAIQDQLAATSATSSLLQAANQLRTDQQLGSGNSAPGTTSLVTKAGSATLMGLAVDTGVLTRSVNGATATLSANADALYRTIVGSHSDCVINCKENGFEAHVLNPINVFGSFALAQSSTTSTPTSGQASGTATANVPAAAIPTGAGKLTALTAKYQIVNKYDPRSADFQSNWDKQIPSLAPSAIATANAEQAVQAILLKDSAFTKMANNPDDDNLYKAAASDPSGKTLITRFENDWVAAVSTALKDPGLPAAVSAMVQDQQAFRNAWHNAIANAAGVMLSVQYTFNKPLNQPYTHDFTVIYGYNFGQYGSLTFNGAASLYDGALPAGAKYGRLHYGQASGEYDRNLTAPQSSFQAQLSLAGYWQYQPEPSVLNIAAGTVAPGTNIPLPNGTQEFVGTAGSLWVVQGGLTIKGPGGVNIPLGVSWSNKTDLLQGNKIGAQIGLSYSFSSLAGIF
jgi:hypothetical protein